MALTENTPAPDFTLPSTTGKDFSFYRDTLEQPCILYFYPQDFTPVCTAEACAFRDTFSFFEKFSIPVLGISRDDIKTHLEFKKAHNLPFELLADTEGKVAKLYKAHHPVFENITRRITFLVDAQKKIVKVLDNIYENPEGVMAMVEQLKNDINQKAF